ncbi:MAG: BON domain-containing protein [Deltaproteobacteria bacterium]
MEPQALWIDTWDPSLYDLVLHIHKLAVENAVDIICNTVKLEQFRTTPESQKAIDDLALAAKVKAQIVEQYPNAKVSARDGWVLVHIEASETLHSEMAGEIECMAGQIPGVRKVSVHLIPTTLFNGRHDRE